MQMIVKFQNFVHEILILFCFLLALGCSVVRNTRPQMIINWCGSCQQQIKDSAMQYYCYFYHQNSCVFLSVSFPKKSQILYLFIISISHTLSLSSLLRKWFSFIQFQNAKTYLITITTMTHSLHQKMKLIWAFSKHGFWIFNNFKSFINTLH